MRNVLPRIGFVCFLAAAACTLTGEKYPPLQFAPHTALGSKNAPVVILEFSDFHCPFCRRHATTVLPQLKREYVDTGKVLYVFRHFPLDTHPEAPAVGAAAACAGRQGKFWEMHDRLFATAARATATDAATHANAVGLDLSRFRACMDNDGPADVRADTAVGREFGISGTPAFVIGANRDGTAVVPVTSISGADTFESFVRAIETVLRNN